MSKFSKKRAREASDINTDLVAIYEDLASETGQVRFDAALRLLSADYGDEELARILKRLFRGLCSSRKAARLGFSIALTEFLARYVTSESRFTVERILAELKEQTEPAPGASGQELRDYYFGRLFATEALITSKIFLQTGQEQSWTALVSLVLELYHKKQWLQEECGWVLQQALVSLRDQPAFLPLACSIFELLQDQKLLKSLEGIALWITFNSGGFTGSPLSDTVFNDNNPLSPVERSGLLNALRATVTSDSDGQPSHSAGTTWSSKLHFAWVTIFEAAWKAEPDNGALPASGAQNKSQFANLWTTFVEDHLFANAASEQRKYWGFLMVQHFTKEFTDPFFSAKPNFLRCFYNQLSKAERHLHGIATKTLKTILNTAQADGNQRFAGDLLIYMVSPNGRIDFDKITKTKFLEKLITMATPKQREACLVSLNNCMGDADGVPRGMELASFLTACADFIVTMVKNEKGVSYSHGPLDKIDEPVMPRAISILTNYGFIRIFSRNGDPYAISEDIRSTFRARLFSAISHSITLTADPSTYAAYAATILSRAKSSDQPPPMSQFDKATIKKIKRAGKNLADCSYNIDYASETKASNSKVYQAFRLLFSLSIIQACSVDAEALSILEELDTAYSTNLGGESDMEQGSGGVVDIILSLISKQSVLFRRVGKEAFSSCTAMIDQADLDAMFDVLQKREDLIGQQELFDAENSEESQGEGSNSEEESIDGNSNEDVSETAEEDPDEVIEFENKLAQALGTHKGEDELENGATDKSDEEMMDDEQMAALDPLMSNMFKERRKASHKKENKNAKETIVQFKTKVLELLEIYVQQEAKNQQNEILAVIPGQCLACIQATKSKLVSEKAANVIKTALNAYKLNTTSRSQKQISRTARQELRAVQTRVLHPASNLYLRACSQASLLLAKIMLNNGSSIKKVWREYSRTGKKMATDQEVKVVGALFQDWFNWLTSAKLTLSKRATVQ